MGALWESFGAIPMWKIWLVVLLTPLAYLLLSGYDLIAFRYVGRKLPIRRILFAGFIGYAYSNSISMTPSMAIRYRLYSQWGVSKSDIAKVIFFHIFSTWIGFFAIGGLVLFMEPAPIAHAEFFGMNHRRWMGAALLLALGAYLWLSTRRDLELRIKKLVLPFPRPGIVVPQTLLATADWALMGLIPYILLPIRNQVSYLDFISVFLLAQITQILSHVPGGIGVFESVLILLLKSQASSASILAALLVYRVVFMLLPLGAATLLLAFYEFKAGRRGARTMPPPGE